MHRDLLVVLALLFAIIVLQALSARLKLSFPILLVLGGLGISLVPGLPPVRLDPDLVFIVFLPPLLYEAAWFTSWREFWRLRNAILLQALGLVLFTSLAIAAVARAIIPEISWPVAFLLGGIVSPPDAVAASSVLHGLKVPRASVAILEGESLINDASSLIVVRFALATLVTGHFSFQQATGQFFFVSILGVVIGLAIGTLAMFIHKKLASTPPVDTALTLMTPYFMYIAAEHFHASGVLAVVAGGLYLSSRSHVFLSTGSTRVQAVNVWNTVGFLLNGMVFILIGLQLPSVVRDLGDTPLMTAIGYGVVLSLVAIVVRIVWTFPAAYLPSLLPWRPEPRRFPNWKMVMLIAWAGMRGVVSLASALAVPLVVVDQTPFPHRALVVFVTFVVILVTLVFQGLSLPLVVRALKFDLEDDEHEHKKRLEARMAEIALLHLRAEYGAETEASPPFTRLKSHYEEQRDHVEVDPRYREALATLLVVQKRELLRLRDEGLVPHELAVQKEHELDLEADRLARG